MKNKIEDLRNHLFDEIERLKECSEDRDVKRAKAVSELSARITDTARAEIDYLRAVSDIDGGAKAGTGFISQKPRTAKSIGGDHDE